MVEGGGVNNILGVDFEGYRRGGGLGDVVVTGGGEGRDVRAVVPEGEEEKKKEVVLVSKEIR